MSDGPRPGPVVALSCLRHLIGVVQVPYPTLDGAFLAGSSGYTMYLVKVSTRAQNPHEVHHPSSHLPRFYLNLPTLLDPQFCVVDSHLSPFFSLRLLHLVRAQNPVRHGLPQP